MTEKELEIVRLKAKILALETVLSTLFSALGRTFPSFSQSFRETGNAMKEEYSMLAVKGYPPELSDLLAGEYQEALDELLKFLNKEK